MTYTCGFTRARTQPPVMVDYRAILNHVVNLTTNGSRVTGYDGNFLAGEYIANFFQKYGLKVERQQFNVAMPLDFGANITVISPINESFDAFALWPNDIQPCPARNLQGKLIYVEGSDLEDFNGKDLRNAIILMEFNTRENWLFAANMGAKAVIFIEPEATTSVEAMSKIVDVPLYLPRLFVNREVGEHLKNLARATDGVKVKINLDMRWREVNTQNIIGIINGTKYPTDVIIIAAHYDTWSVVPKAAFGANDAIGIAFLLELAKYFSAHRPLRTIWFVAFSGHWQAMAGCREFIEKYYFSQEVQGDIVKPWIFINLDMFSCDTNEIQLLATSYYSGAGQQLGTLMNRYAWIQRRISDYLNDPSLASYISEETGRIPKDLVFERLSNVMWWGSMQNPYILESEIVLMTGAIGFSITSSPPTIYNRFFGVPINDLDSVEIERLNPAFTVIIFILESLANEGEWPLKWMDVKPTRTVGMRRTFGPMNAGYLTLLGKVVSFDYIEGWYRSIPNAIVKVYSLSNAYRFSKIIALSDENGTFEVHGIAPFTLCYNRMPWMLEAWVLNETNGAILYAPDLGIQGAHIFPPQLLSVTHPMKATAVVANLRSVTIFNVLDPRNLKPSIILDPRTRLSTTQDLISAVGAIVQPLDFDRRSDLLAYGASYNGWETVALAYVPPNSKVSITIKFGSLAKPTEWPVFLTNSTEKQPEGFGIQVTNEPVMLHFTAYHIAKDIYYVSNHRYDSLRNYNVRSLSVETALNKSKNYLKLAEILYKNNTYSKALAYALWAYTWAWRAYTETMSLIQDASVTTIFFFILILVTSFLIERLLLNIESGIKRIVSLTTIVLIFIILFSQLHPSFHLMSNSLMGIFASFLLVMLAITVGVLSTEVERVMTALSTSLLGKHVVKQARLSSLALGLSMSMRLMRKHRLVTFLTLLTTFAMCTSIVSLTSTSTYHEVKSVPLPPMNNILYETGVFLEKGYGIPPDGSLTTDVAYCINELNKEKFVIMPRIVYYPQTVWYYTPAVSLPIDSSTNSIRVSVVVGITPEESALFLEKAAFSLSRNFTGMNNVCFLTENQAKKLNVTFGDNIKFKGNNLLVVGILKSEILDQIYSLDGFPSAPLDPMYITVFAKDKNLALSGAGAAENPRIGWDDVLITPAKFAERLGGYVTSISIIPKTENVTKKDLEVLVQEIASTLDVNVWYIFNGSMFSVSRFYKYYVLGYEGILVIVFIGALNIVISILSSLRERTGEIQILSYTGLTPLSSMIMFLMESVIYALISGLFGYFAGYAIGHILIQMGFLPKYFPLNYASMALVYCLLTVVAFTLLGALFPSISAYKKVTPSLKRKWELPTKPKGDFWQIPLPFRFPTKKEAVGILFFFKEFFDGSGATGKMYMVIQTSNVLCEEMRLEMDVKHAPYERGITSHIVIHSFEKKEDYYFNIYIKRTSGDQRLWVSSTYYFVDALRKQFMLWRSLSSSDKEKYINRS